MDTFSRLGMLRYNKHMAHNHNSIYNINNNSNYYNVANHLHNNTKNNNNNNISWEFTTFNHL